MRLFVTGATGFIGSRLALAATEQGHAVVASGMAETPAARENAEELRRAGIELRIEALDEAARASEALAGVEAVIHLAAAQHEMNVPDAHFRKVNVEGSMALLAAARSAGVGRFVHGSTIGVYGESEGTVDESTPPAPSNIYGVTKLEGERAVLAAANGLPVVAVRISEVYGPGDRRLLKLFRAVKRGRFFHIGPGENLHHAIYVDDLVRGLLLAARHPGAGGEVFVLPGKDAVTTNQMVDAIAAAVGARAPTLRMPLAPFMAAAIVLETVLRPMGIQPPLHRRRMDFFRKSFRLNGAKAAARLDFRPEIGFREGAERTARWYERNGLL